MPEPRLSPTPTRGALGRILSLTDLTLLGATDTPEQVHDLCRTALEPVPGAGLPPLAAVCVWPSMVRHARAALHGSAVRIASVAGAFPYAHTFLEVKLEEARRIVGEGAHELDAVIDRGLFLAGEHARVHDEIAALKEACGAALLKVILETGELGGADAIRRASALAIDAGADFLKTSTGKGPSGATQSATLVMLEVIQESFRESGHRTGLKVAGGIRTVEDAWPYLVQVEEVAGAEWSGPELFRFGASSLVKDVRRRLRADSPPAP